MFCEQCGNKLSPDSRFCEKCGATVPEGQVTSAQENKPAVMLSNAKSGLSVPKFRLLPKAAIIVAAVIVVAVCAFFIVVNTGRNYAYASMAKSYKAYQSEINDFVGKNAVLKTIKSNLAKSYEVRFDVPGANLAVINDKKNKILLGEMSAYQGSAQIFFGDKRLVLGVPSIVFLEFNPKDLDGDFNSIMDTLGVQDDSISAISNTLDTVDLSYSSVTDLESLLNMASFDKYSKRYTPVLKKLLDKAEYSKEKSEARIGGKTVKVNQVSFEAGSDIIMDWAKKDLLPTLRKDTELRDHWNTYAGLNDLSYNSVYDFDELLDELEDSIEYDIPDNLSEVSITAKIHKNVVVSLEISVTPEYTDKYSVAFSALGDKYRLNDISFVTKSGRTVESALSLTGDHIGSSVFTSDITWTEWGSENSASIEWDTTKNLNNLEIESNGYTLKSTFSVDGDSVEADINGLYMEIMPYKGSLELPKDTIVAREITEEELGALMFTGALSLFNF